MRVPEFDTKLMEWDRYKRFYILDFPFVQFDNGDVWVISDGYGTPYHRRYFAKYNVSIRALNEIGVNLYTPSFVPVNKHSIDTNGVHSYLFDYDLNRVYPLFKQLVATHASGTRYLLYSNGSYESGTQIRVYMPSDENIAERKQFISELVSLCKTYIALYNMMPLTDKPLRRALVSEALRLFGNGHSPHDVYCKLSETDKRVLASITKCTPIEARYFTYLNWRIA